MKPNQILVRNWTTLSIHKPYGINSLHPGLSAFQHVFGRFGFYFTSNPSLRSRGMELALPDHGLARAKQLLACMHMDTPINKFWNIWPRTGCWIYKAHWLKNMFPFFFFFFLTSLCRILLGLVAAIQANTNFLVNCSVFNNGPIFRHLKKLHYHAL